jgi:flavin-dependent dehydrogenase
VLDHLLAEAAVAAGADLRTGTRVEGLRRDRTGRVTGVTARLRDGTLRRLSARHVVGADGLRSATARWVGAGLRRRFAADVSSYYFYVDRVPWGGIELHTATGAYAGVFPTHDGQACVWMIRPTPLLEDVRRAGARRTAALTDALDRHFPDLGRRVRDGRVTSPVRGIVAPPNHVRDAFGPGWALVGDAGYHRDPITGHGITDAFRDAELLADALHTALEAPGQEVEALRDYERARDAALEETFELTRQLAGFPPCHRFVELQIALSEALDREAHDLASRPAPAGLHAAPAA